jgi:hypothetical protein
MGWGQLFSVNTGKFVRASTNARCPLVAQSGHHNCAHECPLSGVKRTSKFKSVTSAFEPIADIPP